MAQNNSGTNFHTVNDFVENQTYRWLAPITCLGTVSYK
ncbi:hypothetical protein FAES_2668 [Fibrella aestuarina BUZ 2]|uniref:Uncharacterized protein n=1 Tax=Fibrella aestuarina BUZ 2 TaxID=1166018 RepID=I0K974_9BACT|nr:hypothetical protein FAES_2668 [Fibrella aestuarina BUZ 2]